MTTTEKKIDPNSLCYYIIQRVKNVRFELDCSQAEFAEKTGVAKSLIEKYERGIHSILPDTLEKIANRSSRNIEYFFPEPTNCINREDKQAFDLVQILKSIKNQKVRDVIYALTKYVANGIQVRKATIEIKPVKFQMSQKAKDWRFARGYTRAEFADKSGMPDWQIVNYEKGNASFKIAPKIAKGLSLHSGALLPTSKAESYFEDEDTEGKILNIMKEYHKVEDQMSKDLLYSLLARVVQISEEKNEI